MLFASFPYLMAFLPLVVVVCIGLQRWAGPRAAQLWIVVASIYFYARATPFNLVFLIASIAANWLFARWIERSEMPAKKRILVTSLVLNVAYLCVFKYLNFLASMVPFLLPRGFVVPRMPFPLGVSFFTVTQIMYLVDCYEGTLPAGTFFDHITFVSFFPYIISGPLGRAKRMRHQFGRFGGENGTRTAMISRGLFHFAMGAFKKSVIADSFARVSTYGYNTASNMSAVEAWTFSVAYALQLYFDFSGYSDMAIGSAMMLGIDIPRNFDAPYSAKSIIDFWQRWHISLTQFITTYLYTPILRSFKKRPALAANMLFASALATFFAMGIAGLWHGAAWTYVIYGFLHGSYLAINQYWRKKQMPRIPAFPSWLITYAAVLIALVYFGASDVPQANARVISLFNLHHLTGTYNLGAMRNEGGGVSLKIFGIPMLIGLAVAFVGPSAEQLARDFRPTILTSISTAILLAAAMVFMNSSIPAPFVYFRF